jgi:hypothetical protein
VLSDGQQASGETDRRMLHQQPGEGQPGQEQAGEEKRRLRQHVPWGSAARAGSINTACDGVPRLRLYSGHDTSEWQLMSLLGSGYQQGLHTGPMQPFIQALDHNEHTLTKTSMDRWGVRPQGVPGRSILMLAIGFAARHGCGWVSAAPWSAPSPALPWLCRTPTHPHSPCPDVLAAPPPPVTVQPSCRC